MTYLAEAPTNKHSDQLIRLAEGFLLLGKQIAKKTPARIFFDYHKAHFKILFSILRSARRADPIRDEVRAIEQNIDRLVESSQSLLFEAERLPPSPWEAIDKSLPDLPHLLDPTFIRSYRQFLDAYETTANQLATSVGACLDTATKIEQGTPLRLMELRTQIRKLPEKTTFDFIVKQRLDE